MTLVLQNLATFIMLVIVAMFTENAVFTRAMGVSRLVKLVGDSAVDSIIFCALLTLIQVISAPFGYLANTWLSTSGLWYREYIRPLALVICAGIAFIVVMVLLFIFRFPNAKEMLAILPMATFNSAVLGSMLISSTQSYTFVQTMGFALGSGLAYGFAALIVSEGQRKLHNRNVPSAFRGLPINLVYIGILALAIYGLTGHRVAI